MSRHLLSKTWRRTEKTSSKSVLFVGSLEIAPGARHPEAFSRLVPIMIAISSSHYRHPASIRPHGVAIDEDGVHWKANCKKAVVQLADALVQNARPTPSSSFLLTPILWRWRCLEANGRRYPCCNTCGKLQATSTNQVKCINAMRVEIFLASTFQVGSDAVKMVLFIVFVITHQTEEILQRIYLLITRCQSLHCGFPRQKQIAAWSQWILF